MMLNFRCHLGWAMGYPDIWLDITLGMSVRVSVDEVNIWMGSWVKQIAVPYVRGSHQLKPWTEQKGWVRSSPPVWLPLSWDLSVFLPTDCSSSINPSWVSNLLAFALVEWHHWLSWPCSLLTANLRACLPTFMYMYMHTHAHTPTGFVSLENLG